MGARVGYGLNRIVTLYNLRIPSASVSELKTESGGDMQDVVAFACCLQEPLSNEITEVQFLCRMRDGG